MRTALNFLGLVVALVAGMLSATTMCVSIYEGLWLPGVAMLGLLLLACYIGARFIRELAR